MPTEMTSLIYHVVYNTDTGISIFYAFFLHSLSFAKSLLVKNSQMSGRSSHNSQNQSRTSRSRTRSLHLTRSGQRSRSQSRHRSVSNGRVPDVSSSQNSTGTYRSRDRRLRGSHSSRRRRPASPRPRLPATWDADLTNYLAHMRRQSEAVQDPAVSSRSSPSAKRRRRE